MKELHPLLEATPNVVTGHVWHGRQLSRRLACWQNWVITTASDLDANMATDGNKGIKGLLKFSAYMSEITHSAHIWKSNRNVIPNSRDDVGEML